MSKEPRIPVMEIFGPTIQGEGLMSGTVTHFLRTGGCGLRCKWCDTMFAVDPKQIRAGRAMMTTGEILTTVKSLPQAPYLTLTGGDPCLHQHLGEIINPLNVAGIRIAVETQGELFPDWLSQADVITFSPKPPSSGNVVDYRAINEWIYSKWGYMKRATQICIKVVCFDDLDYQYALQVYNSIAHPLYDSFYFTAGTPGFDNTKEVLPQPTSREAAEARAIERILGIVGGERWLADKMVMHAGDTNFNHKVHVGCQQHALLWPEFDRGR